MEITLVLNGLERIATIQGGASVVLAVASGNLNREGFSRWVFDHHRPLPSG